MNVLKGGRQALDCFVLGVDHFGKNLEAGNARCQLERGVVRSGTGVPRRKELSGNVSNTRLAVRKNRGGQQGREYPFVIRTVDAPEPDEDGEANHNHGRGLGRRIARAELKRR